MFLFFFFFNWNFSFCTPVVNSYKQHGLVAVANPTDTVHPTAGHCTPGSPSSQESPRTRSLGKLFSVKLWQTLENVAGLLGDSLSLCVSFFLHVQIVLGHPPTLSKLSGKGRESFVKSGVSWSVEVFQHGLKVTLKTALYLPCEKIEQ